MGRKIKKRLLEPSPCRLLILVKSKDRQALVKSIQELSREFGKADYEGPLIHDQDGVEIRTLSFSRPTGRDELVDIKKRCLHIEGSYVDSEGNLTLDLDTLLVGPFSVVRADTLELPWRIYLYNGIWAETVYQFEGHTYQARSTAPRFFFDRRILTACNDVRMIMMTTGGYL